MSKKMKSKNSLVAYEKNGLYTLLPSNFKVKQDAPDLFAERNLCHSISIVALESQEYDLRIAQLKAVARGTRDNSSPITQVQELIRERRLQHPYSGYEVIIYNSDTVFFSWERQLRLSSKLSVYVQIIGRAFNTESKIWDAVLESTKFDCKELHYQALKRDKYHEACAEREIKEMEIRISSITEAPLVLRDINGFSILLPRTIRVRSPSPDFLATDKSNRVVLRIQFDPSAREIAEFSEQLLEPIKSKALTGASKRTARIVDSVFEIPARVYGPPFFQWSRRIDGLSSRNILVTLNAPGNFDKVRGYWEKVMNSFFLK